MRSLLITPAETAGMLPGDRVRIVRCGPFDVRCRNLLEQEGEVLRVSSSGRAALVLVEGSAVWFMTEDLGRIEGE